MIGTVRTSSNPIELESDPVPLGYQLEFKTVNTNQTYIQKFEPIL
jgi:hypothetical protein